MKPFFSLLVCLALISSTGAQRIVKNMKPTEQPGNVIANKGSSNGSIEARISNLFSLAASTRPKPGDTSKLVLIPISYLNEAIQLSDAHQLPHQYYKASMDKLDVLFHAGKIRDMESMLLVDIDSLKAEVARYISRYYNDDHHAPRNISKAIEYASISLNLSLKMKDWVREINAHNQLGHIYRLSLRYSEAEEHFTKAINLGKGIKQEHVAYSYICMIVINERKGYFNRALQYALEGLKYLEFTGTETWATDFYRIIGRIYYQLDDYEKSLEFIELSRSMSLRKSLSYA